MEKIILIILAIATLSMAVDEVDTLMMGKLVSIQVGCPTCATITWEKDGKERVTFIQDGKLRPNGMSLVIGAEYYLVRKILSEEVLDYYQVDYWMMQIFRKPPKKQYGAKLPDSWLED